MVVSALRQKCLYRRGTEINQPQCIPAVDLKVISRPAAAASLGKLFRNADP